jgi:hypothetical protein
LLRPVLDRAVLMLGPVRPEAAATVEELRQRAEAASAELAAAPWWRQRPDKETAAWERAMAVAARLTTALARDTTVARQRWQASMAAAQAELERGRARLRTSGMSRLQAAALSRAAVLLESARQLAAAGRFEAAAAAAERAIDAAFLVELRWQEEHRRFSDPQQLTAWRQLARDAVAWSARTRSPAIIVDKLGHRLLLYRNGNLEFTVPAELGTNGLRRKRHGGDQATPEGRYQVTVKKQGAATRYYKALLIDYPNREDLRRYRADQAAGAVPRGVGPGGLIEIHGDGGRGRDWTEGCIALGNADMDRIFEQVAVGTPVIIVGHLGQPPSGAE